MWECLTPDDLYAQILMLQAAEERIIFLVEGENDVSALAGHVEESTCNLLPGYGSSVVIGAMRLVEEEALEGVIALLDQDWSGILTPQIISDRVFYTDKPDLDATIFHLPGPLSRVVPNFSNAQKRASHLKRVGADSPLDIAMRLALPIGVLRFISERDGMALKLRDFPVEDALTTDSASIDVDRMCEIAIARSKAADRFVPSRIARLVEQVISEVQCDPVRYCCGHDLTRCLSAVIRKRWGGSFRGDVIERSLRAALSCRELASTTFFGRIRAWSESHDVLIWCCDVAALN